MDDKVFVKFTKCVSGRTSREGVCGGYFLGALFIADRDTLLTSDEIINVRVLRNKNRGKDYLGALFSIARNEVTIVNNDDDLEECERLRELI